MPGSGLTLVLSGYLCRPQTANTRPFWLGFIELQRRLPSKKPVERIVAHSWNLELADLAKYVYAPQAYCHQHKNYLYAEYFNRIEAPDHFLGAMDYKSALSGDSIQNLLGDICSRIQAIRLLDGLSSEPRQVLLVRWDLSQADESKVNRIVADASLSEEYIYLPYSSNVDEGYDDSWIIAPMCLVRRLRGFDSFVLDSLSGKNQYLDLLTKKGWPRARVRSRWEILWSYPICQKLAEISLNISQVIWQRSQGGAFIHKVMRKVISLINRYIERPPLTAENSCVPGFEYKRPVFSASRALRISTLFKYFLLSEGLRDRVRFLTDGDFEVATSSGQLICPQKVVLLVWQADAIATVRLNDESLLPLAAVYDLGAKQIYEHLPDNKGGWITNALEPKSSVLEDRLSCGLSAAARAGMEKIPILIIPSIEEYLACTDWYYLNALVKYIAWLGLGYVSLVNQRHGTPHSNFPDLKIVRAGEHTLSFQLAAGTIAGVQEYLELADYDLRGVTNGAARMRLEFPALAKEVNLF